MVRRMLRGVGYSCMQLLRVRTCGIGDAVICPDSLQDAARQNSKRKKTEPVIQTATLAKNPNQLLPGEFAPIEADEVARIYASALESI
eukprot:Skav232062  [mRNA]  locus=scaffold1641:146497:146760:- [translate_table: standard]